MLPRLRDEIDALKAEYPGTEEFEQPDGSVHVIVPNVPLPSTWEPPLTRLLMIIAPSYPNARPNFFTEPLVNLKTHPPQITGSAITKIGGIDWRSFCWNPSNWDLSRETLLRFLKFAVTRFDEQK